MGVWLLQNPGSARAAGTACPNARACAREARRALGSQTPRTYACARAMNGSPNRDAHLVLTVERLEEWEVLRSIGAPALGAVRALSADADALERDREVPGPEVDAFDVRADRIDESAVRVWDELVSPLPDRGRSLVQRGGSVGVRRCVRFGRGKKRFAPACSAIVSPATASEHACERKKSWNCCIRNP